MRRVFGNVIRRLTPLLAAGVLLQAGSCNVDTAALTAGVTTSIVSSVVRNFVFGAFNLSV